VNMRYKRDYQLLFAHECVCLLFADLRHDQRLGLLDALLKDDALRKFALLSTRSPVFGFDVGESSMECLRVRVEPLLNLLLHFFDRQ
jgi:hypothetical protein